MKTTSKKNSVAMALFVAMISFSSQAQLSGGVATGVSTGAVKYEDVGRGFNDVIQGKNILGYEAGIYLKYNAGPVYIKPMVLYSFQSGDVTYQDQHFDYKSDKMGVPLMLGLNVAGPFSIEAGPVYNYVVDMTQQFNSSEFVTARSGIGYRAGLCLNFSSFIFSASYEGMTYSSSNSSKTGFSEPYKLLFGVALKLGGCTK